MTSDLMRGYLAHGVDIGLKDGGRIKEIMKRFKVGQQICPL